MTEKQKLFQELNDRMVKDLGIKETNKIMEEYKTCDKCCYDILDDDGDLMEHECLEELSNCCSASVYNGRCLECFENCITIKI